MTNDDFNALVEQVQQLNDKTNVLSDSVAKLDLKYSKIKYLSKLIDVNISYPAENDVLVYDKTGKWKNAQYDEIGLSDGEGGESNIYVIGIGDSTSPTNENVYSAARTIEDWVSSKNNDYVEGNLTFYNNDELNPHATKIFIDEITSRQYNQNTVTGSGFIYQIKSGGSSYIEVDELAVRKSAVFNKLQIKKIDAVGGSLVVSVAANEIVRVEETNQLYNGEYQDVWRCYYIKEDSMTGETIMTDFKPGDIARIQSFNIVNTGDNENVKNHYYCGEVLGVGNGYIDLSQKNVDESTNDSPKAGDSLVQFGNFEDISRQNLISISSYDSNAPSIMLYQGVNSFNLTGKSIIEMGYDPSQDQNQGYFNVYGRMYIGTKPGNDKESYVKYDPTIDNGDGTYGRVLVKADIIVEGEDGDDFTMIDGGHISTKLIDADQIIANVGVIHNELQVGDNFRVDTNGNLTASNAVIRGDIYALEGTIGGFKFTNSGFSSENFNLDTHGLEITTTDYNIHIGSYLFSNSSAIKITARNYTPASALMQLDSSNTVNWANNGQLAITAAGGILSNVRCGTITTNRVLLTKSDNTAIEYNSYGHEYVSVYCNKSNNIFTLGGIQYWKTYINNYRDINRDKFPDKISDSILYSLKVTVICEPTSTQNFIVAFNGNDRLTNRGSDLPILYDNNGNKLTEIEMGKGDVLELLTYTTDMSRNAFYAMILNKQTD